MILFGFVAVGYPFVLLWAGEANANAFVIALLLFIPTILPSIQNLGIEILRAKICTNSVRLYMCLSPCLI